MKRSALKRKPWRRALGTAEQRLSFKRDVLEADGGCVMVGRSYCDGPFQACHVIRKATLRKRGYGADTIYCVDAAFCACQRHHQRWDRGLEPGIALVLPERCKRFVQALGLDYLLRETA